MSQPLCPACGIAKIEKSAACNHCGSVPKPKRGRKFKIFLGVLAVLVLIIIFVDPPELPAKTPEQIKAEQLVSARGAKTIHAGRILKAALREPGSAQWMRVIANEDGSVICLEYRARNGFGGVNVEHTTVADGKVYQAGEQWNEKCNTSPMYDMADYSSAF